VNVPNILTLVRIGFVPLYLLLFFSNIPYHIPIAFAVLVLAGLTDVVDGYIARKYKQVTEIGSMLDPLADKLMMIAVITSFYLTQRISVWAALFFYMRDVGMIVTSAIYHLQGKKTVPANALGKLTTVLFYAVFFLIMFEAPFGERLLWIVIAFAFVTSAIYLMKVRIVNRVME
jgi:cardiolipin synthase